MKVLCISKWAKAPSPDERDAILPKEVPATLKGPPGTPKRVGIAISPRNSRGFRPGRLGGGRTVPYRHAGGGTVR